jgi:monofunctional glycosyltransferase
MKKNLIIYDKSGRKKNLSRNKFLNVISKIYSLLPFILKSLLIILICLHQLIFLLIMLFALSLNGINPGFNSLMVYRSIHNKQKNRKIVYVPIKKIPKWMQQYMVGIEDDKFYKHHGIDPQAILRAYGINKRLGFNYSGGSTITQQLARTLFLTPEKNYFRKYFEVVIAMELELFLSKDRILELYFNNIEFGKGIYGIGRAALFYYEKPFAELSMDEINKLITIVPSPRKYTPFSFYYNDILLSRYIILCNWSMPKETMEEYQNTESLRETPNLPPVEDNENE